MTTHSLRMVAGAMLIVSSLGMARQAAKEYGALKPWKGRALMGLGFFVLGASNLVFASNSEVSAILTILAAGLVWAGLLTGNASRKFGRDV